MAQYTKMLRQNLCSADDSKEVSLHFNELGLHNLRSFLCVDEVVLMSYDLRVFGQEVS